MAVPELFFVLVFIFGTMIGSFLNALIYRLPRGINIAIPRSSCPHCNHQIKWFENIPLLSYLFLAGKCSNCKTPISLRYPLVELYMGIVAIFLAPHDLEPQSLYSFFFFFSIMSVFVVHFLVDMEHQILPDSLNAYLAIIFFLSVILSKPYYYFLTGAAIGVLFPLGVSYLFYKLKGQVGLGGGDIKLWGALGIYLGPMGIVQNIFLSCFLGAVIGLILIMLKITKREDPIPFGPFIIIIATLQIFFHSLYQQLMNYLI